MTQKKKPVVASKTTKPAKKTLLAAKNGQQQLQEGLESINKKLAQSQVNLEAAYRQYTDLYDFAPVGYFTLARNGAIHQVNLAGADLLGMNQNEVTRLRLAAFVSSESRPTFNVFFEKLLSGEGKETCELLLEKKGKEPLWARLEATCFEGGNVCRAMLTDITERKRISSLLQARMRISEFAESHTFDELLQKTLDEAKALTRSQIGFAHFLEADPRTLQLQMWSTDAPANMRTAEGNDRYFSVDEGGVWAECVSTRAPLIHNDYPSLAHRKGIPQEHAILRRVLVVPVVRNNLIVMLIGVGNKSTDYDNNDVEALSQLADSAWDIIQRKQAEEKLQASERTLKLYVEYAPAAIAMFDRNMKYIVASRRYLADYRLTDDNIVGRSHYEIFPEISERWKEIHRRCLAGATEKEEEDPFPRADGTMDWVRWEIHPWYEKFGEVGGLILISEVITERKRAEKALKKSEALYHGLVETSQDLIWQCDAEGRYTYLNPAWEQVLGYKTKEMLGKKFTDFQTPTAAARDQKEFARLMRGNTIKGLETTYIAKSGKKIHLVFNAKFLVDENGKINGTHGTAYDNTERKKAEQALRESESLYRTMNENSPLGMHFYELNNHNQLIFVGANPAASKLLGVDNSEFIGKTIEEAFPPLAQTEVPERYREAAEKGIQWSTEQITYEDGQIKGAFEVRAFQTTPGNMVAVFADITERKKAEQALEEANRELQTALARQQQLAHTDELTDINNRRYLYELAEHEFEIAVRYQQPLSVIMFDIDHFKEVNDTFGHTVGDQILQRVTQTARAELRSTDVIGRYGGEEFVIVLPMTNAQKAHPLAERIRMGVAAMRVPTEKGDAVVTISIGIVEMTHDSQTGSIEVMIHRADEAMYAAKQSGRNRTEIG